MVGWLRRVTAVQSGGTLLRMAQFKPRRMPFWLPNSRARRSPREAFAMSSYYAAYFLAMGVLLPFFPLWLAGRGYSSVQVGWILAGTFAGRLAIPWLVATLVDRAGSARRYILPTGLVAWGAFASMGWLSSWQACLAVAPVAGGAFGALLLLGDTVALRGRGMEPVDYGSVRLWGSVAFICSSVFMGKLVDAGLSDAILMGIIAGIALTVALGQRLPTGLRHPATAEPAEPAEPMRDRSAASEPGSEPSVTLFSVPALLVMSVAALVRASHGVYEGYSSLAWQQLAGFSSQSVGLLWAEGVVAEIAVFLCGSSLIRRLGWRTFMAVGAAAACARWLLSALTLQPGVVVVLQALHALSFAAVHLGWIHFVRTCIAAQSTARALGLQMLAFHVLASFLVPFGGMLFAEYGLGAYWLAFAVALLAIFVGGSGWRRLQSLAHRQLCEVHA